MSKKVLIVTYYWPPAGGPGVQRWLKFIKYLPEFGIEPIVYCPENPNYPVLDPSLTDEIPKNITILKKPISEPYGWAKIFSQSSTRQISSGIIPILKKQTITDKLLLFIRGNFFIPDARKNWVKPSVKFLTHYISEHNIETVITTGPPHSLHLIGLALRRQLNIKWIADFRDPWTTIGYHKKLNLSKGAHNTHLTLESQVLNEADHLVVTSHGTMEEFVAKTKTPISVITNGYDNHRIKKSEKDKQFSIAHIGSLLSERNPINLWQVLKDLVQENKEFSKALRIKFVGLVSNDVLSSIKSFGLDSYVENQGYQDHNKAIKEQMASQLLLLIEIDSEETKAIIPGKLFEYIISETPIIAIGPTNSDVESIINETNTGHYFSHQDSAELKSQILKYFSLFKDSELRSHPVGVTAYSRRELTKQLVKLL